MMKLEKLFIYPGLIVKTFEVAFGNQLEQIAVALIVLDQQSKMIGALVGRLSAMAIGLGDIDFAANDWFYTCFLSCHIKIDDAVHGAVVSNSKAIHTQFLGPGNKLGDAAHAIEQAIFGVDVKVSKLLWHLLDYNICGKSTKRGISHSQNFFTSLLFCPILDILEVAHPQLFVVSSPIMLCRECSIELIPKLQPNSPVVQWIGIGIRTAFSTGLP